MAWPALETKRRRAARGRLATAYAFLLSFALLLSVLMFAVPSSSQASFQLGLQDAGFDQPNVQPYAALADRAMGLVRGNTVRLAVYWAAVAPVTPRLGFNAADPGDPQYAWSTLDDAIRAAARQHLRILLNILDAPTWAEGPGRPNNSNIGPGAWEPSPSAFAQFVHAAASRYSGQFAGLPRVSYWELWNEENLPTYLAAPDLVGEYRALLNAGYREVKSVHQDNVVVLGGLAPASFLRPYSIAPLPFAARLLCLTAVRHSFRRVRSCPSPAYFDVFAYHPYSLAATPTKPAVDSGDVLVADSGKVATLVHSADRLHSAGGPSRHPIWVTEFGWFTNPPNKVVGDRPAAAARYTAYSLYELARADVSLVIWQTVTDRPNLAILGGGVFARAGATKPTLRALSFPFVAGQQGGRGFAWGRAPVSGTKFVVVERLTGGRWVRVARVRTASDGVFSARFGASGNGLYRARVARGPQSLAYDSAPIPAKRTH